MFISQHAFRSPSQGQPRTKSNNIIQLQRKRDLARLQRLSDATLSRVPAGATFRPPAFSVVLSGSNSISVAWIATGKTDPWSGCDPQAWLQVTRLLMSSTRAAIQKEQYRMMKPQCLTKDENDDAAIHRMLKSDALPSQLYSVVDRGQCQRSQGLRLHPLRREDALVCILCMSVSCCMGGRSSSDSRVGGRDSDPGRGRKASTQECHVRSRWQAADASSLTLRKEQTTWAVFLFSEWALRWFTDLQWGRPEECYG
jgi:hypothetical protein